MNFPCLAIVTWIYMNIFLLEIGLISYNFSFIQKDIIETIVDYTQIHLSVRVIDGNNVPIF